MDLWGKGGFRYLWREWRERAREQDMKERGHAIPRLPAVPETPMELLTSAFLSLASSLYLSCFKSSTISRLISLPCRFACTANTRYDVDAGVGKSLTQSLITRVITNSTSVESDRRVSRRMVKHFCFQNHPCSTTHYQPR